MQILNLFYVTDTKTNLLKTNILPFLWEGMNVFSSVFAKG